MPYFTATLLPAPPARNHVHMNSTKWLTLTEFVKYLGRTGQCKVEETEKGWFITLINRDEMEVRGGGMVAVASRVVRSLPDCLCVSWLGSAAPLATC